MRSEVQVVYGPGEEVHLTVDAAEVLSFETARQWLDEQFFKHGCEPMRGSGKVLIADKILGVAAAVGPAALRDPAFGLDFARAASGALSKALVKVDVARLAVSF